MIDEAKDKIEISLNTKEENVPKKEENNSKNKESSLYDNLNYKNSSRPLIALLHIIFKLINIGMLAN